MKIKSIILFILSLISIESFAQNESGALGFWSITDISGEVALRGQYNRRKLVRKDYTDFQMSRDFFGGLRLNTKSYIWHPNFLQIDIGGKYFPSTNLDRSIVIPDYSDVNVMKNLYVGTTLFNKKPVTLYSYLDLNQNYSNRENLTNLRSDVRRWGSTATVQNKILPFNLGFDMGKSIHREVQTERTQEREQKNFRGSTQKSFGKLDASRFNFAINSFLNKSNLYDEEIRVKTSTLNFNNRVFFNEKRRSSINTVVRNISRKERSSFENFTASEGMSFPLPFKFNFGIDYGFSNQRNKYFETNENFDSKQNTYKATLSHRLFSSLNTMLRYERMDVNHTLYTRSIRSRFAMVNYRKKIPSGDLNCSYNYSFRQNIMNNERIEIPVFEEQYILKDEEITVLDKPNILIESIVIKDETRSVVYQPGFDYLLFEVGDYIEIQRIPGGLIADNSTVYIDYILTQKGSYEYNAINQGVSGSLSLLYGLLNFSYTGHFLDYDIIEFSDELELNYITKHTYQGQLNWKNFQMGIEHEDQESTITPYKRMRYFMNINKNFGSMNLSLNGDIMRYNLNEETGVRKHSNISAKAIYSISSTTSLNINVGYREQKLRGLDLKLITAQSRFKTSLRKLFITVDLEMYRRDYPNDRANYFNTAIELSRKF